MLHARPLIINASEIAPFSSLSPLYIFPSSSAKCETKTQRINFFLCPHRKVPLFIVVSSWKLINWIILLDLSSFLWFQLSLGFERNLKREHESEDIKHNLGVTHY